MQRKPRSRALAVSALAASLGLAGLTLAAPPAGAAPAETDRIAGDDRYETAADIAAASLPDADTVVLTTGQELPDALSANPIAGANDAPILLTFTDSIPADTQASLDAMAPTNVVIVGGTAAVSEAVEAELEADGYTVTREAGANRFATAADVARAVGAAPDIDVDGEGDQAAVPTVALANGLTGLPDAVAASPMLHRLEIPLLLTGPDALNEDAADVIAELGAEQVLVLGGTSAVSTGVENELEGDGVAVERLAGTDRWGTATAIADFEVGFLGFDPATTHIASGTSLPDALAGGPLASVRNSPIVLVSATAVPIPTREWIEANAADIDEIVALGGTAVINDSTLTAAAALADEGDPQFVADPAAGESVSDRFGTVQTVTFSGIDADAVNLALVDCEQVTVGDDGALTFADADATPDAADLVAASDATITTINGVSSGYGTDEADVAVEDDGTVEVDVDTSDATCAVLVAFVDADDDGRLDLDADDAATEPAAASAQILATNPDGVEATPEASTNPYGETHTVTAQLTDASLDGEDKSSAEADVAIRFARYAGADCTGTPVEVANEVSDADGAATYTFDAADPDPDAEGDSTQFCIAVLADIDGDGTFEVSDEATKTFSDEAGVASTIELTPASADNRNGAQHTVTATVTATVTDQFDDAVAGTEVTFVVNPGGTADTTDDLTAVRTTDADGVATFTYQGPAADSDTTVNTTPRVDEISADVDAVAGTPDDTATKRWFEDGVENLRTGVIYETVDAAEAEAQTGDVLAVFGDAAPFTVDTDGVIVDGTDADVVTGRVTISGADDVTVRNFELRGDGTKAGFYLDDAEGFVLRGNTVTGGDVDLTDGERGVENATGGAVEQGTIVDGTFTRVTTGVFANPTADLVVENNTFDAVNFGIGSDPGDVTLAIDGNAFTDSVAGVGVYSDGTATIEGNTFDGNDDNVCEYLATGDTEFQYDLDAVEAANSFTAPQEVVETAGTSQCLTDA